MPAVKPSRHRIPRSEVRERILAAAMSVFAAQGFAGATIDAIADAAGFTKGAVYSNFGSKDDLFFELLDQQIAERRAKVTALVRAAGTRAQPELVGGLLTQAILDNRDWHLLFIEYWLRAMRDPDVGRRFAEHRAHVRAAVVEAIDDLHASSSLAPQAVATLVLALNNGLSIEEFAEPGTVPKDLFGTVLRALEQG